MDDSALRKNGRAQRPIYGNFSAPYGFFKRQWRKGAALAEHCTKNTKFTHQFYPSYGYGLALYQSYTLLAEIYCIKMKVKETYIGIIVTRENLSLTRSYSNQPAHLQKLASILKFSMKQVLYRYYTLMKANNKGADQTADAKDGPPLLFACNKVRFTHMSHDNVAVIHKKTWINLCISSS